MLPAGFADLAREIEVWKHWAEDANRDESGWESDAPNWFNVLDLARRLLLVPSSEPETELLAFVFGISEEGEQFADHLKEHILEVPDQTLRNLLRSPDPRVRWQVYDSLSVKHHEELSEGLIDTDEYVRRRAYFRLIELGRISEEEAGQA